MPLTCSLPHTLTHMLAHSHACTPTHSFSIYRVPAVRDTVVNKTRYCSLEILTKELGHSGSSGPATFSYMTEGKATSAPWASWIHYRKGPLQCSFISGNKYPILVGDVDNGGSYVWAWARVYGHLSVYILLYRAYGVPSSQFCCKPKTVFKNYFEIFFLKRELCLTPTDPMRLTEEKGLCKNISRINIYV